MTLAVDVAMALVALGAALTTYRLVRGPTAADRVVASDLLLTLFALTTLLLAARTGEGTYLEVGLVVAVLGFVGTAAVARFLESHQDDAVGDGGRR